MDPESSLELVVRAQAGDPAALDRLLERYRPRLRRWASGRLPQYVRDFTDTDDLVQDALIGTVKNIREFEMRGEWALQAYLRRAVTNRIRDEIKRFQGRPHRQPMPAGAVSAAQSPLEAALGAEVFQRYEAALGSLGEAEREGVIGRLELGCSYEEIALLLDKPSPDAARMAVTRALEKLARLMGDEQGV